MVLLFNDRGCRIGQSHPRAILTDHEAEVVRALHREGMGYKAIARRMEVSVRCVRDIVSGRTRNQTVFKMLEVERRA